MGCAIWMPEFSSPFQKNTEKQVGRKCVCMWGGRSFLQHLLWFCSSPKQRAMRCSFKFHLEIHSYPTAKSCNEYILLHHEIEVQAGIFAFQRIYFKNMQLKCSDIEYFLSKVHLLMGINSVSGSSSCTHPSLPYGRLWAAVGHLHSLCIWQEAETWGEDLTSYIVFSSCIQWCLCGFLVKHCSPSTVGTCLHSPSLAGSSGCSGIVQITFVLVAKLPCFSSKTTLLSL